MQTTLFKTDLLEKFAEQTHNFLNPLKYSAQIFDTGTEIIIQPNTHQHGQNRKDYFYGMQIIFDKKTNIFEISEYQAGKHENELHIYAKSKTLKNALCELIKGNKRKPIEIYK